LRQCLAEPQPVLVLHDLPTGAMRHLDQFLARLADAGGRCRQDFPEACVPMRRGRPTGALDAITVRPAAPGNAQPKT
jgi:hypothetical protein